MCSAEGGEVDWAVGSQGHELEGGGEGRACAGERCDGGGELHDARL